MTAPLSNGLRLAQVNEAGLSQRAAASSPASLYERYDEERGHDCAKHNENPVAVSGHFIPDCPMPNTL